MRDKVAHLESERQITQRQNDDRDRDRFMRMLEAREKRELQILERREKEEKEIRKEKEKRRQEEEERRKREEEKRKEEERVKQEKAKDNTLLYLTLQCELYRMNARQFGGYVPQLPFPSQQLPQIQLQQFPQLQLQ